MLDVCRVCVYTGYTCGGFAWGSSHSTALTCGEVLLGSDVGERCWINLLRTAHRCRYRLITDKSTGRTVNKVKPYVV
jgi:hypothetical protein